MSLVGKVSLVTVLILGLDVRDSLQPALIVFVTVDELFLYSLPSSFSSKCIIEQKPSVEEVIKIRPSLDLRNVKTINIFGLFPLEI